MLPIQGSTAVSVYGTARSRVIGIWPALLLGIKRGVPCASGCVTDGRSGLSRACVAVLGRSYIHSRVRACFKATQAWSMDQTPSLSCNPPLASSFPLPLTLDTEALLGLVLGYSIQSG
jgi:hypothetical protein